MSVHSGCRFIIVVRYLKCPLIEVPLYFQKRLISLKNPCNTETKLRKSMPNGTNIVVKW